MPFDPSQDEFSINNSVSFDGLSQADPFLARVVESVRRYGERNPAGSGNADVHPSSFSIHGKSIDKVKKAESLKRKNSPAAIRSRLGRLGVSSAQIPNAFRDHPISFAPIPSAEDERDTPSIALERILGRNDLIGIDFLESASVAARSIGRVSVRNRAGRVVGFGTGSMVSPSLFLTNNHVIVSPEFAANSSVEFGYESATDGTLRQGRSFRFAPERFFLTDISLDFSLVAVDTGDGALAKYGWLPMVDFQDGSVLIDEFVNIVQHPNGQPKQIAIRDNQVTDILPDFLHYRADTQPGSSGAPVFTDQWELVALHHSGIPRTDSNGKILTRDGALWEKRMGDAAIDWIANEGIRIERILAYLNDAKLPDDFRRFRDELHSKRPEPRRIEHAGSWNSIGPPANAIIESPPVSLISKIDQRDLIVKPERSNDGQVTFEIPVRITLKLGEIRSLVSSDAPEEDRMNFDLHEAISIDPNYDSRKGYDSKFLGTDKNSVPLPKVSKTLRKRKSSNAKDVRTDEPSVFNYHHFSIIFDRRRKLAICTAVNIDGQSRLDLKRDNDRWIFDPRLPRDDQAGQELYATNEFDLGHLVRRLDPAWGKTEKEARLANDDTFHFTNCAPQHELFNRGKNLWAGLEDHLLDKAGSLKNRMTVFTGPVFREDDPLYRNVRIPREYWKVAAYVKAESGLISAAFLVSQANLIEAVVREEGTKAAAVAETYQTTVAEIEKLTGIDFGRLRQVDVKRRPGVSFAPGAGVDRKSLESFDDIDLA